MAWIFNLFGRKKLQFPGWLAGTVQALGVREGLVSERPARDHHRGDAFRLEFAAWGSTG
jgi:hypothetical protein